MTSKWAIVNDTGIVKFSCSVAPTKLQPGERASYRDNCSTFKHDKEKYVLTDGNTIGTATSPGTVHQFYFIEVIGDDLTSVHRVIKSFEEFFEVSQDLTPPKPRFMRLPSRPTAFLRLKYLVVDYVIHGIVIE